MQIIHTRLRNNCSDLKQHLFWKNIVASPICRCGEVESNTHYFFECRFYCNIRVTLRQHISAKSAFNIDTVLFGDNELSLVENEQIFHAVHDYIDKSKRFSLVLFQSKVRSVAPLF